MSITIRTRAIKNGCRTIYLDCYENGRRKYEYLNLYLVPENGADSRRQNEKAMAKAVEAKAKRTLGIEDEATGADKDASTCAKSPVFAEWLDGYLAAMYGKEHLSRSYCNGLRSVVRIIKLYLAYSHRPNMAMGRIDKAFVKGFFDYARNTYRSLNNPAAPKPLAPPTLLTIQGALSRMLNEAVKEGIIESNPVLALDRRDKMPCAMPRRGFLSRNEVKAMAAAPASNELVRRAFMFCCFTGLRHSDMAALTWGDIRQTSLEKVISLGAMKKTKRPVSIPLSQSALKWMPDGEGKAPESRVFEGLVSLSQCNVVLKRMAKAAGITKNVSFHISRHTFATLSLAAGGDIYTVGKLLGHTSIDSTQIYAEVAMETKLDAVNRIDEYFKPGSTKR